MHTKKSAGRSRYPLSSLRVPVEQNLMSTLSFIKLKSTTKVILNGRPLMTLENIGTTGSSAAHTAKELLSLSHIKIIYHCIP